MISKPTTLDFALLVAVALIWASAFTAIKVGVGEVGPLWLAAVRVFVGFLAVALFTLLARKSLIWPREEWPQIVGITLLSSVFPFWLIAWGEQLVDAGVTSLLLGTGPILALTASHFTTNDDKFTWNKALAVVLGMAGVITVLGTGVFSESNGALLSHIAILLGAACYVTSGLLVRKVSTVGSLPLTVIVLGLASAILLPIALVDEGLGALEASPKGWFALLYLGVFPTGIAYVMRYHLIRKIGLSTFSLGLNFIPIFGVAIGAALLGEVVSPQIIVALAFVVSALFIARR